ncbi:MAG: hypothetical protein E8D40_08255 [Nitrospira sp.]|nr:MAG: hypothetical protein E8D40_08255 [Nitrospira sp.]
MAKARQSHPPPERREQATHRVHLPGFLSDDVEIGLGDVVKRTTSYLGIKPCGGCEQRATALNRWMVFTKGRSR